ncbi:alpha/beta hydrolase [Bryobacterales bacterium F-183]|nr:alpha/beta hydrolase [Bryobacterales bacterium F-183]
MRFLLRWTLALTAATVFAQTGDYLGTIQVGVVKLRLALHIVKNPEGAYQATVDSLDQGARGLPVDLSLTGNAIRFTGRNGMTYEGEMSADFQAIKGAMTQNGQRIPLDFAKVDKIEGPKRPQTPQRPFPYKEEEVTITSNGVTLGGTLSIPQNATSPAPAAIFLTGSGAQDRDETLFEHKPFLVISDMLVRAGIATLRLDDRGVGKSSGNLAQSTLDDLASDALAAYQFLKSRKDIKPTGIGFIGHSEGGATAPMAAAKAGDAAFVVMLAGTGVPGDEILLEQGQAALKAQGAAPQMLDFQRAFHQAFLPVVKAEPDPAKLPEKLNAAFEKLKAENAIANMASAQLQPQIQQFAMPAMRSFIRHDPRPFLEQLKAPVLAINGSLDIQVVASQNLPAIAATLAKSGNKDFMIVNLPGLNHLFQNAKTGAVSEYMQLEETISPRVLDILSLWLKARIIQ